MKRTEEELKEGNREILPPFTNLKGVYMKYYFFVSFFITSWVYSTAQQYHPPFNLSNSDNYKTLDSAYLKVSYKLTYIKDTTESNIKYTDLEVLLIGKHTSKYFSQQFAEYNQYIKQLYQLHKEVFPSPKGGTLGIEIFKDYNSNKLTVTDLVTHMDLSFLYKEDFPQINWTILNENQTISLYPCQKATTTFRGRKYEAWFTTKIPINNGPWKFGGLPGLILQISDTQNNFVFECTGIESLRIKEPIKFYPLEYTELKREDYNQFVKRFHKNIIAYYKALGRWVGSKEKTIIQLPYNPLEKN
jgi:GLPGLI family protein